MEVNKLYNGEVELIFEPGKHMYSVGGKKVDGVTSVLGVLNKPALLPWAAKMAAEYYDSKVIPGYALDEVQKMQILKDAKMAYRVKADTAATIGSMVHAWIDEYAQGKTPDMPVNELAQQGIKAFLQWVGEHHVVFQHNEKKIYSKKYNYAGTFDFIAVVDGRRVLGDIKTSSGIYDEMFLQTAAYQLAYQEENPNETFDGHLIVNCRKTGELDVKEALDGDQYEKNKAAFLAALTLYRRQQEWKDAAYIEWKLNH